MRRFVMVIFFLLTSFFAKAQHLVSEDSTSLDKKMLFDNDSFFVYSLPEVVVYAEGKKTFASKWEHWKYRRLIRNVKAAYPYAKLAGKKLRELDLQLASIHTERQRKLFVNQAEDQLRAEFEENLKQLTVTQGRILIKLVYRETGNTTYELVQDVKGNFSAGFWQAVARLFGSNLKSVYDPLTVEEDSNIEHIIELLDMGLL
jgi:hypothetical protein